MSLERKIKRNQIRKEYGNQNMKNEWKGYQISKYSLGEYAKMQKKTIKQLLAE